MLTSYKLPDRDPVYPTLVHLNADTTWLLQIPLSTSAASPHKTHFTILIDPWLAGPQWDYYKWFSTQWHVEQSAVQSLGELGQGTIDAVVVSHEFGDHCHEATLREVDSAVPVYATEKAAELIRSYKHFANVHTIPSLPTESTDSIQHLPGLPDPISITRVVSSQPDLLYYHSAICISYTLPSSASPSSPECILYTPHGLPSTSFSLPPSLRVTALLHGLHDVRNPSWLGGQMNLGALNAVRAVRKTGAKYWVGTHDEVKKGAGLVSWVLKRKVWTVEEAMEKVDTEEMGKKGNGKESEPLEHVVLGSGGSLVLR